MTIGVWGDSITFGSCDSEALGWCGRLRKSLPTEGWNELYNFGISGETSTDILKRFEVEASAIRPSDIIFAVGINDSKFPSEAEQNKVSLSDYKENLEKLIKQAKSFTDKITIVGATRVDDEWRSVKGSRFLNEEIEKYNLVMKEEANQNQLVFIDMFSVLDPALDLADGLHPNAQGYQKMFEVIRAKTTLSA